MKNLILGFVFFFASTLILLNSNADARDLTYRFGMGYRQLYSNAFVAKGTKASASGQLNGMEVTYSLAPDFHAGIAFGFTGNFSRAMVGPSLRYDLQRLFNRDPMIWEHLNIFVEGKFLAKMGNDIEAGLTLHAPYLGFEILPFTGNNFAILTGAGLVFDFVEVNRAGFTNAMFGDVGVRYYF